MVLGPGAGWGKVWTEGPIGQSGAQVQGGEHWWRVQLVSQGAQLQHENTSRGSGSLLAINFCHLSWEATVWKPWNVVWMVESERWAERKVVSKDMQVLQAQSLPQACGCMLMSLRTTQERLWGKCKAGVISSVCYPLLDWTATPHKVLWDLGDMVSEKKNPHSPRSRAHLGTELGPEGSLSP